MPFDHRDLEEVAAGSGRLSPSTIGIEIAQMLGDDLAPAGCRSRRSPAVLAGRGRRRRRPLAPARMSADRLGPGARGEGRVRDRAPPAQTTILRPAGRGCRAPPGRRACPARSGRDPSARRPRPPRATQRGRPPAAGSPRNQRADHVVEMPVLGDVERVAVVGAQAHVRRVTLGQIGISASRSF
jgi:hypothetical protein